ncbi:MAG: transposase [Hatfieldvirus porci]|uniref:Transposase n=1 Tax=phage Lak_Megaphage_RVC_JS4_GC31 TaxID=3109228 RepID=A0ABZ0Z0Y0_9CAUD|nr:MAG: transposase [phage Lak_Megaphage_RVC_AP3_GC31]WQJ52839.1 MAG: transposase [phage Lak_Megaphage_RVC_JS4_GC31]
MKLSQYAKELGVCYKTAWNLFKQNKIKGAYQLESGTVIVPNNIFDNNTQENGVILYARTSSSKNKTLLENQVKRLEQYAIAKGYKIKQIVKEYGSGLNDERKLLSKILKDDNYDKIIVENKDRLTRFGFNWIQLLTGNRIEVINESKEKDEDITKDLISIIHCFSARIYGLRRSQNLKNNIKKYIKEIEIEK